MNQPETASVISSSAEVSSAEYFAQRQLKQGTVGWLLPDWFRRSLCDLR